MKRFTDALEVLHLKVGVTILKIQKIQPAQVNVLHFVMYKEGYHSCLMV